MNLTSNDWKEEVRYGMPKGWWKAFGKDLCDELEKAIRKLPPNAIEDFQILEVKEKFGCLHIYTNWHTKGVDLVLKKYEDLSQKTCCICGALATKISMGWICPYCDDHAPENSIKINNYITDSMKEV